jgi:hypothetical protein
MILKRPWPVGAPFFEHDEQFVRDEHWIGYGLRRGWALLTKGQKSGIAQRSCCPWPSTARCSASAAEI